MDAGRQPQLPVRAGAGAGPGVEEAPSQQRPQPTTQALPDPIALAKRIAHRRAQLLASLDALAALLERRQAAEGRYAKDLAETHWMLDEAGRGRELRGMDRVGRAMQDELEQTTKTHAAVFEAYARARRTLAALKDDFFLADYHIKEAIQDALSTKPIDPRLPRHGPLASQHWRTTFESTLTTRRALGYDSFIPPPPRLPDADDLARHLGALHADFERWYAPRLAGVVRSLEREKDEALARLALWRGRRPGLDEKGEWEPEANIDGALDGLLGHAPPAPPVLPDDVYQLIIRAAIARVGPLSPFVELATSVLHDDLRQATRQLVNFRLVHSSWKDIVVPLLEEHQWIADEAGACELGRRLARAGEFRALARALHISPTARRIVDGPWTGPELVNLHTLDGLPMPHSSDPPMAIRGLSNLRRLSIRFAEEALDTQPLADVFPDGLPALESLRLETARGDLHDAFSGLARAALPQLVELQLAGFSFRGPTFNTISPRVHEIFQAHGLGLRSLLVETVSAHEIDWAAADGRSLFGHLPQLRHLSTNVPELALLFERQFTGPCSLVFGDSRLDVAHDPVAAQVYFRRFLAMARKLVGADQVLPPDVHIVRRRSTLTSVSFWQADFGLPSHRRSPDLALAAHHLLEAGIPLLDGRGTTHRYFWLERSPAEIEAQMLADGRTDGGSLEQLAAALLPALS